jgi:UPF0755 protein
MKKEKKVKLKIKKKGGKWRFDIKISYLALTSLLSLLAVVTFSKVNGFDLSDLASLSFYQNLANPSVRVVNIKEGLRKEEVADILEKKLNWNEEEREEFLNSHLALNEDLGLEGRLFPKSYLFHKDSTPKEVAKTMIDTFESKTKNIKKSKKTEVINEDTILKIASMIQRESGGKSDMKLISGIIWNRVFSGMKLQIDATLQYAKGDEDLWWPKVSPEDKYIDSPYNTYIYKELPPTPISNAGLAAIEAAYNPIKTSCVFYLHDKKGKIHCAKTYEEHKKNIEKYY